MLKVIRLGMYRVDFLSLTSNLHPYALHVTFNSFFPKYSSPQQNETSLIAQSFQQSENLNKTTTRYLEFSITLKSTRTCPENQTNKMWTTMPETLTRDSETFYSVKGKKSSKLFSLP